MRDRTSTGAILADLVGLRKTAEFIVAEARKLEKEVREAHDGGLLSLRSSHGGGIPTQGTVSRTTEASAQSLEYRRLQQARKGVADRVSRSKKAASSSLAHVENAGEVLFGAWLDTDPELGPQRRERRDAVANHTRRIYPTDQQKHRPPSTNGQGIAHGEPTQVSPS